MEWVRHPTIVLEILKYLSPIEYICLRQALSFLVRRPDVYPTSRALLWERIQKKLVERLGPDVGRLLIAGLMLGKKEKIMLTGGFLLSILQGDPILPEQDIDIICISGAFSVEVFTKAPLTVSDNDNPEGYNPGFNLRSLKVVPSANGIKLQPIVECKLQFIITSKESWENARKQIETFDLAICRNAANMNELYIQNIDAILRRRCVFELPAYLQHHTLSLNMDREAVFNRLLGRFQKYRNRGYDIIDRRFTKEDILSALDGMTVEWCSQQDFQTLMGKLHPNECQKERKRMGGTTSPCSRYECEYHRLFYKESWRRKTLQLKETWASFWMENYSKL